MTKQWENILNTNLYDPNDFHICPNCDFHFNKRTFSAEDVAPHIARCAVEEVTQLQLELHPEVSDPDGEC